MSETMMVVDVNNMAWKIRHKTKLKKTRKEVFVPQHIFIKFLDEINGYFRKFKANGVLLAFEGGNNFRKRIYPQYKSKEIDDIYYEDVQEAIKLIRHFFEEYTSVKVASVPEVEADDVIALATQLKDEDIKLVILSTDKDFVQLLKHPNVTLYSPVMKEERTTEDAEFDLFLKCIRGDPSDNIPSSYPKVRKTKLEEAFYGESINMLNLMETIPKNGTQKVAVQYEFNRELIDLERQPEYLKIRIADELDKPATGSYNQKDVLKFAKENSVKLMAEGVFSGKYRRLFTSTFFLVK